MSSTNPPFLTVRSGFKLLQKFSFLLHGKSTELLTALLVVLLCWQLAYWTWIFVTPMPPLPVQENSIRDSVPMQEAIRAAHLFGSASSDSPAKAPSLSPLDLKLSGVFAAAGKLPAVAIINVEHKGDLPFWVGDMVLPEVTLEGVNPNHIVLRRGGVLEKLLLEQKNLPVELQKTAPQLNVRHEGKGRFGISRDALDNALSDPSQLANAGRVKSIAGQGLRVEEAGPGSLMSKLGLQGGDTIRQINGKPIEQATDILQSYRTGGKIRLEGTRNGQSFEYNYTIH